MSVFGRWPLKDTIVPDQGARDGCVEHIEVLPSTVGEWTGYCDKNGRRIYEGDRVRLSGGNWTDAPETAEIELHAGCWCASYPSVAWSFLVAKVKDAEAIGTVFDEENYDGR